MNINVRPEVAAFALAMEAQLKANDHKTGWKNDDPRGLFARLVQESDELKNELREDGCGCRSAGECGHIFYRWSGTAKAILKEAADVANFSMMIADVCGGLAVPEEIER